MITIKNVKTQSGLVTDINVFSPTTQMLDAKSNLLNLPAFIDIEGFLNLPFETSNDVPGKLIKTLFQTGITTSFTNAIKPGLAEAARAQLDSELKIAGSALSLYFFADGTIPSDFNDIGKFKDVYKGIKTSIDLAETSLPPYGSALERVFQIAAQEDLVIVIDLLQSDQEISQQRKEALRTLTIAITLTEKYSGQLFVQHVRTQEEIALIKNAKEKSLLVYANVSCPHLFISEANVSETSLTPSHFLPTAVDQVVLWEALSNGIIDMISSGSSLYSTPSSALAAAKLWMPSLVTAYQSKKLLMDTLIAVTSVNSQNIFRLPPKEDTVLVDLNISQHATALPSPYPSQNLLGWPVYIIANGEMISVSPTEIL